MNAAAAQTVADAAPVAAATAPAALAPGRPAASAPPRASGDTVAPLQLQIDRLVIAGLPPLRGGERRLRAALDQELRQLLAEQPLAAAQGGAVARLPALQLELAPDSDAAAVGRAIASAIHRSLQS